MALKLKILRGKWYAWGKVKGILVRRSTGYSVGAKKAEEHAKRAAAEIEYQIRGAQAGWTSACPTVAHYWRYTFKPTYTAIKREPALDDQVMARALPVLGAKRLDEVTTSDCVAFLNRCRASDRRTPKQRPKRIAEGTVQRYRGFLQGLFQRAVEDGHVARNPWIPIKRVAYVVRDRVLSVEEQAVLLPRLNPEYQRAVRFLLATGVRIDECRGIHPVEDIDWPARTITLRERRTPDGVLITRTKGGRTRTVPIPLTVIGDLETQLAECGRLWTQTGARFREVLANVCRSREAQPARTSRRGRMVAAIEARPAIPRVWPHALRHTFATRYLQGGGDIYKLAQILGDTVAVVERHYAHLLKADHCASIDRIDVGLGKATRPTLVHGRFGGQEQG